MTTKQIIKSLAELRSWHLSRHNVGAEHNRFVELISAALTRLQEAQPIADRGEHVLIGGKLVALATVEKEASRAESAQKDQGAALLPGQPLASHPTTEALPVNARRIFMAGWWLSRIEDDEVDLEKQAQSDWLSYLSQFASGNQATLEPAPTTPQERSAEELSAELAQVKAENAQNHANAQIAFRKLSDALTGGAAGTWDEVFHAAESAEAALARLQGERQEVCICAAVRLYDGRVIRGHRHHNCFVAANEAGQRGLILQDMQGFVTSRNRYVDRAEGLALQLAAGIPSARGDYNGRALHSEDLY